MAIGQPREHKRRGPEPGSEAAHRGGLAVKTKYGSAYYRKIGKLGGAANMAKHGSEHYTHIGKLGGEATRALFGREHYSRIGKIGGQHHAKNALHEV